jgi:hypothetical protein
MTIDRKVTDYEAKARNKENFTGSRLGINWKMLGGKVGPNLYAGDYIQD